MALINCPECDKQISEKAKACPNCGFPIEEMNKSQEPVFQFPELPNDLSIGKPITNWGGNSYFKGVYDNEGNVIEKITLGVAHVMMHDNGLAISGAFFSNPYPIHNSQIINLSQISRTEIGTLHKDVVGRAALGAIIYGPTGAVIGALTAKKQHSQHYLIINYWDVDTKKAQSLIVGGDRTLINAFIKKHEEEFSRYIQSQEQCPYCAQMVNSGMLICQNCGKEMPTVKSIGTELQEIASKMKGNLSEIQGAELNNWQAGFKKIGWLEEIGQNTKNALSNSSDDHGISRDSVLCVTYADVKGSRITSLAFNQINMFSSFAALIATSQKLIFFRPDKKLVKSIEYKCIDKIEHRKSTNSIIYNIFSKFGDSIILTIEYKNEDEEKIVNLFFERITSVK